MDFKYFENEIQKAEEALIKNRKALGHIKIALDERGTETMYMALHRTYCEKNILHFESKVENLKKLQKWTLQK